MSRGQILTRFKRHFGGWERRRRNGGDDELLLCSLSAFSPLQTSLICLCLPRQNPSHVGTEKEFLPVNNLLPGRGEIDRGDVSRKSCIVQKRRGRILSNFLMTHSDKKEAAAARGHPLPLKTVHRVYQKYTLNILPFSTQMTTN